MGDGGTLGSLGLSYILRSGGCRNSGVLLFWLMNPFSPLRFFLCWFWCWKMRMNSPFNVGDDVTRKWRGAHGSVSMAGSPERVEKFYFVVGSVKRDVLYLLATFEERLRSRWRCFNEACLSAAACCEARAVGTMSAGGSFPRRRGTWRTAATAAGISSSSFFFFSRLKTGWVDDAVARGNEVVNWLSWGLFLLLKLC